MKKAVASFTNNHFGPLTLRVEPWGEVYKLPPLWNAIVSFESEIEGQPEVSVANSEIVIYGWEGCGFDVVLSHPSGSPAIDAFLQYDSTLVNEYATALRKIIDARNAAVHQHGYATGAESIDEDLQSWAEVGKLFSSALLRSPTVYGSPSALSVREDLSGPGLADFDARTHLLRSIEYFGRAIDSANLQDLRDLVR